MAEVWVKLESENPTGSYKDRMALAMIEGAELNGRLQRGQTVVEATFGSTGVSLAFVCRIKGYPLRIVSSDIVAAAKVDTMRALGAVVDLLPSPAGYTGDLMSRLIDRSREIAAETGGFATDQFRNRDMLSGYHRLGEEILEQVQEPLDAVCLFVGTAGCFVGTSAALRERHPGLLRVAIEPEESAVISGGRPGTHRIEGGGVGFWPPLLDAGGVDQVELVSSADAVEMAQRALAIEGLFSGPSTGANLLVALRLAKKLGPGRRVVTVQVDSGLKYVAHTGNE